MTAVSNGFSSWNDGCVSKFDITWLLDGLICFQFRSGPISFGWEQGKNARKSSASYFFSLQCLFLFSIRGIFLLTNELLQLNLCKMSLKKCPPPVGLEPTTFELEVQHASPLRHGGGTYHLPDLSASAGCTSHSISTS